MTRPAGEGEDGLRACPAGNLRSLQAKQTKAAAPSGTAAFFFIILLEQYFNPVVVLHQLVPGGGSAVNAGVVVFFPFGQDQEQPLPDGYGPPAAGAEKLRGVEVLVLLSSHLLNLPW